jgi:hypothetical protein
MLNPATRRTLLAVGAAAVGAVVLVASCPHLISLQHTMCVGPKKQAAAEATIRALGRRPSQVHTSDDSVFFVRVTFADGSSATYRVVPTMDSGLLSSLCPCISAITAGFRAVLVSPSAAGCVGPEGRQ